jgi:threonine aldolase
MKVVDLKSDTVTRPSLGMRQAIMQAEVGDDVFGEDPTVNRLQEMTADLFGKEAALFVPSGTMANQIAIKAHTRPVDEVICHSDAHCFNYEGGGAGFLSGVQLHPLPGPGGLITAEQITHAIRPFDHHYPQTSLVCLENTHNRAGGSLFPMEEMERIYALCQEHHLAVHLDGARIMNAHIASGVPLKDYGRCVDSISICLSKGLGAPVGSLVVGSEEFIDRAHRYRKVFGGGMRQVGILAAAGIYALENNVQRLEDDHRRAQRLANALNDLEPFSVDMEMTQTNIVIANVKKPLDALQVAEQLKNENILAIPFSQTRIRFVTHLDIDDRDVDDAIDVLNRLYQNLNKQP